MLTDLPKRPLVWGHRGAMDFAPQNTLASFQLAVEQGADGIELDVQLSKDGVPMVFHDARVDKLTDGRGALASLPYQELRRLDAGSHFGRSWRGHRMPTLDEVFEKLPVSLVVNVELKTALSEETWWDRWMAVARGPRTFSASRAAQARQEAQPLAEAVAKVLKSIAVARLIVSSFDPFALEAFWRLLPNVPLGFLHSPTVPWNTPALIGGFPIQAWHPHHSQITPQALGREHAAGHKVHVWTVNDPLHAVRLATLGVNAVITNRPGEILTALGG